MRARLLATQAVGGTGASSASVALVEQWRASRQNDSQVSTDTPTASTQQLLAMTIHPLALSPDRESAALALSTPGSSTMSELLVLPAAGTPLHPAAHLTMFPLRTPEPMLAADGYDADWSPPKPFTRRMWAGGVIEWQPHNPLRVGQPATMTSRLLDAVAKRTGRGDAVFVSIEKRIENTAGEAMREQRSYVYLEHALPASGRASEPSARSSKRSASSDFHVTVHPTTMTLFRYSALTFNSHLIHYDQGYATDVEGYPGCLVHGPLTCTMLLDLFRRNAPGKTLTRFAYRAVSPVVVGQDMTLHGKWAVDGENKPYCELWATRADGAVAMKGTAEYTDAA